MFNQVIKNQQSSTTFINALRVYPQAIRWLFADGKRYLIHFGAVAALVIVLLGLFISQTSYWLSVILKELLPANFWGDYESVGTIAMILILGIPLAWLSAVLYKTIYILCAGTYINVFGENIYHDLLKKKAAKISFGSTLRSFWIISIPILLLELFITTLIGGVSIIPGIGIIATILGVTMSSYFWGASMFDLYREMNGVDITMRKKNIRSNKWFCIGNGIGFFILLLIPIVGLFIAPAASFVAAFLAAEKAKI